MSGLATEYVNNLAALCEKPKKETDYYCNGLLYCGMCKTPKQCRINLLGGMRTVPCNCTCEADMYLAKREQEEAYEQARYIERLKIQGIQDKQIYKWTFANDDKNSPLMTDKALKYCHNWQQMRRDNIGLLLWGDVGTGKTFLAACIANALMTDGVTVMMTNFAKIINSMTDFKQFDRDQESKNDYLDKLNLYDLLIIDDLGAERQSEFALETVYSVIDSRQKSRQPLIVTTNMMLDEVRNPKDIKFSRIYDRILEMCVPIQFKGESRRKQVMQGNIEKARLIFSD